MDVQLRLPDIKGDDREQLRRIRSYLYQLVPQLQWALETAQNRAQTESEAPAVEAAETSRAARTAVSSGMGLSVEVTIPEKSFGRGGAGCRYRTHEGRVSVSFSCGAENLPRRVNETPLPEAYRPVAPVHAVCHAELAHGGYGVAFACVNPDGNVILFDAHGANGADDPIAVDGFVEFLR